MIMSKNLKSGKMIPLILAGIIFISSIATAQKLNFPEPGTKEFKKYEKKKQEMIQSIVKENGKVWVKVPISMTNINGNPVSLSEFHIGKFEVTNFEYRVFLNDLKHTGQMEAFRKAAVYDSGWIANGPAGFNVPYKDYYFHHPAFDNYPVVNIGYEGVMAFCSWLEKEVNKNAKAGSPKITVRLPYESEWTIAATSGDDKNEFGFDGNGLKREDKKFAGSYKANFNHFRGSNIESGETDNDYADITAPVQSYFPNRWGLYNASGNVAELTVSADGNIISKGGSWNHKIDKLKVEEGDRFDRESRGNPYTGFRIVFQQKM